MQWRSAVWIFRPRTCGLPRVARGASARGVACWRGRVGGGHQVDAPRPARQQRPTAGRREAHHVHGVLDDHWHAGERPERLAGRATSVDRARVFQGIGVEERDRVIMGVVDRDAVEEGLGQASDMKAPLSNPACAFSTVISTTSIAPGSGVPLAALTNYVPRRWPSKSRRRACILGRPCCRDGPFRTW